MDIVAQLNEARNRITVLEGQITAHEATISSNATELANVTAERDTARGELATANANLTSVTAERDTARNELATANADLTAARADVARLQSEARTAEQRALELTGKGGNKALKGGGGNKDGQLTREAALAEYAQIKGHKEKAAYYAQHKDLMFPAKK